LTAGKIIIMMMTNIF